MTILFSNAASSLLNTSISAVDTSIELATGFGARFPNPGAGEFFYITLEDDQGNFEVCQCTARVNDLLTVVRGVDNTVAQAFTQNVTRVELRLVAVVMESLLQTTGGTLTGDVNVNQNNLVDATLSGVNTQILAGEIVGVPLRGATGDASNEIVVPPAGAAPTIGGAAILKSGDDIVAELDVAGTITLDSATVGVIVPGSAFHRVAGATAANYAQWVHDNTDLTLSFANTVNYQITGVSKVILQGGTIALDLTRGELQSANITNYEINAQTVAAAASTTVDYTAGSYVTLTMGASITTFAISNPPASNLATVRLKIVQDGTGGRTITWPAGYNWPAGVAPTLSTGANAVDFIDLWTDDGGTTWYGAFALNMG